MSTEYGKYLLTLGSEETGWHRLTCHGITQVTVDFPKYDLSHINQEIENLDDPKIPSGPLPPSFGGSQVRLLIGIQNVELDPILLGILPSGLGIYQSPFTDIHGSNICEHLYADK